MSAPIFLIIITTITIFTTAIVLYNLINKQPLFSIPWSNENNMLKNDLNKIKILLESSNADITKNLDKLKNENETKSIIINSYKKDGTKIRWIIKGNENGDLCLDGGEKNIYCINQNSEDLFKIIKQKV
jgi:hypothetical protein